MTDESVIETVSQEAPQDPLADIRKMLQDQQKVILQQNEEIKRLNARLNESEKIASATPVKSEPAVPEKSPQDRAWESMMKEMNIKEE